MSKGDLGCSEGWWALLLKAYDRTCLFSHRPGPASEGSNQQPCPIAHLGKPQPLNQGSLLSPRIASEYNSWCTLPIQNKNANENNSPVCLIGECYGCLSHVLCLPDKFSLVWNLSILSSSFELKLSSFPFDSFLSQTWRKNISWFLAWRTWCISWVLCLLFHTHSQFWHWLESVQVGEQGQAWYPQTKVAGSCHESPCCNQWC